MRCDDSGKKRIFGRKNVRILEKGNQNREVLPFLEQGREKGNQNGEVLSFSECGRRIAVKKIG